MKIGIDIDNVISNFDDVLLEEYMKHDKELRNTGIINKNTYFRNGMFDWSEDEEKDFYTKNIEKFAKKFKSINNSTYYINKLREDGHEIYIITGRDNGEYSNPHQMTVEWLEKYNIIYDKLILTNAYNSKEKADICMENGISIMIDDSSRICKEVDKVGIKALLMDTPYNKQTDTITRVQNWQEIYEYISKFQNVNKTKLSSAAKVLIFDQSIGKIISIFLDTFLAAYFYKISEQNILYLSIYNIIGWIFATIGAFAVANIIKCKDKVKLYRFGTFIKSIYIFMIMLLGEKIVNYVYIIGIMYGISTSTTGFPYNMIESENVSNKERSRYLGFSSVATEITSLIVPIFLGAYITFESYQVAAILIFTFSIIKLILSFKIENKNVQNSKVNLKDFYNIWSKNSILKKLYAIEFFKGFNRYGVMSLVVSLLIIYQSNNELELGSWTSLFSLFTIISMYLFGKFYKNNKKRKLMTYSLIAILISFALVFYKINLVTVILYNISYYIFMNIILKITEINLFDYSNKEPFKTNFNTEYFIFRELFLNIGRTLGYTALLFLVGFTQNLANLNIIFVLIVFSIICTIYLSLKINFESEENKV